jgi:hypothetical protein
MKNMLRTLNKRVGGLGISFWFFTLLVAYVSGLVGREAFSGNGADMHASSSELTSQSMLLEQRAISRLCSATVSDLGGRAAVLAVEGERVPLAAKAVSTGQLIVKPALLEAFGQRGALRN